MENVLNKSATVFFSTMTLNLRIIAIILVIVVNDLITLLVVYLLRNFHLSQTVGGIKLSHGKEIHPIP